MSIFVSMRSLHWPRTPVRATLAGLLGIALLGPVQSASPLAGTQIGNQASATYTDASNLTRTVTSNVVTAVVQQVAALTLEQSLSKTAAVGGQVVYPMTLSNTGNGADIFALSTTNGGGFSFTSVTLYADANGDGVADNTTPITSTTALAPGEVFRFVAVGNVPTTATNGQANALTVTATSGFTGTVAASVSNTTTVSSNAVLNVTKTMSAVSGNPGSGPYTIVLTYTNTGNTAATAVQLTDLLPEGMTYVSGSGRWSVTGSSVVLTDATDGTQGTSPTIAYDFGGSAVNRVTATISSVAPGQSGTVRFQVTINPFTPGTSNDTAPSGQPAGTVNNIAAFSYNDGATAVGPTNTNAFNFTVNPVADVTGAGASVLEATQGSTVSFNNVFRNQGNASDTFDVTLSAQAFPAGTAYTLYKEGGVSPLLDTNGNGIPDTGPLASGASYTVVLKVQLPADAVGGPYEVAKTATSMSNPAESVTVTDRLNAVVANTVDLTNAAALGQAGVLGAGAGPEATAQTVNTVLPGATTRFTLYVNNTSSQGDTFNLNASTDSTFGTLALPPGWTVNFRDAAGTVITNTSVVPGGGSMQVFADVMVPASQAAIPAGQNLYFRVLSPSSGAVDRKHDAVIVQTVRSIQLTPNNSGQVFSGGSVVYGHAITNAGNVTENAVGGSTVALTLADTLSGFTSVVYLDLNNNNTIDAGDPVINTATDLGPLLAGQSKRLLVRVTAASGAALGAVSTTTLTAETTGLINGIAAPAVVRATDATTVIAGNLVLIKEQALDVGCNGVADAALGAETVSTGAVPGACIRYRVTVTNNGSADVTNVVVSDATPAHTTYHAAVGAASTLGTVTAPAGGTAGTVSVAVGVLTPSQSVVITFGVRINPL